MARELLFILAHRPRVFRQDPPLRRGAKGRTDQRSHGRLLVPAADEQRTEQATGDRVVVRPAARSFVFPVSAEGHGHGGPNRPRVGVGLDPHFGFVHPRLRFGVRVATALVIERQAGDREQDLIPPINGVEEGRGPFQNA